MELWCLVNPRLAAFVPHHNPMIDTRAEGVAGVAARLDGEREAFG
jgi:hypothetical protein